MSEAPKHDTAAPEPSEVTLKLLEDYDQLLVQHGTASPEAEAFLAQHADNQDFRALAKTAQELRAAAELRLRQRAEQEKQLTAQLRAKTRPKPRAFVLLTIGATLAGLCILWVWLSVLTVGQQKEEAVVAQKEAEKSVEKAEKKARAQAMYVDKLRDDEPGISERDKRLSDLVLALIPALEGKDETAKQKAVRFLYSFGERLDPSQYPIVAEPLVKVAEETSGKPNQLNNYATGALRRMYVAAAKSDAGQAKAALKDACANSKDQALHKKVVAPVEAVPPACKQMNLNDFPVRGGLGDKDPVDRKRTQSYCKVYCVELRKDRVYQIDLRHLEPGLDPYLRIESAAFRELDFDDDSGGDLNARIYFVPPENGTYRIVATSFLPKQIGPFELVVKAFQRVPVLEKMDELSDKDQIDKQRGVGARFKTFPASLEENQTYLIDLISNDFDAYLRVEKDKKALAQDDDSGGGHNARLLFVPQKTGTYDFIATSYAPASGRFTLTVAKLIPLKGNN